MNREIDEFEIETYGPKLGMVPQHNTIWDVLNVDESLDFICDVKGLN